MYWETGNETALIVTFVVFLALSLVSLIIAWVRGRQWGDLSSRKHYGESLTAEERGTLSRSRRGCLIWAGISVIFAALAFLTLR